MKKQDTEELICLQICCRLLEEEGEDMEEEASEETTETDSSEGST